MIPALLLFAAVSLAGLAFGRALCRVLAPFAHGSEDR